MKRPRCLDLFCGAGGAAMGLWRAGFDVVGVDIKIQKRYPFPFVLGDALRPPFRLEDFDLVWASPPCQGYSRMRHLPWNRDRAYPLLIDPVRAMLRTARLSVIENVGGAPLRGQGLRGSMFGLPFKRLRIFEANFFLMAPARSHEPVQRHGSMFGHSGGRLQKQTDAMTLPWMGNRKERSEAIPPEYSEHIGRYAMMALDLDPDEMHRKGPTQEEGK